MVTPKGRMNPQPSGMTVPDESFRVDPSHFPRPQEPYVPSSSFPSRGGVFTGNFLKGAGGAVADIGRSFFDPTSWRWGEEQYNPAFQPDQSDSMAQRAGYGLIDAMTMGMPTGAPDFETMTDADIALQMTDLVDPSGILGDVARIGVKAIPEGTVAGLAWPSWYMRETKPPKGVNKKTFNKLEDMWKHKIWTDDKWVRKPQPAEIREIGARALYMDDIANDVPNTSVDIYMQQGSGTGQTLQMKISQIERGGFGGNPKSLTKESDHFNKLAVDIQSGDDELFGSADYWIESHEDMLQDYYAIDMFDDRMEPIYRTNEEWAKEFNKLSRELADDAKAAEKRITDNINKIMDEELKIMDRGMKEVTGKGTIGGASGTLPPQGTGGVLPGSSANKPAYRTDFVNPDRVHEEHLTGWFRDDVQVDINDLKDLPGARGEHLQRETEVSKKHIKDLTESMEKDGWTRGSVMVYVEMDGSAMLGEGNHRIQAALNAGITEIPTEIKYFGNSNQNPDVWGKKYIDQGLPPQGTGGVLP